MAARNAENSSSPETEIVVLGARRHPLRDLYHGLLSLDWIPTLLLIVGAYLALNALFALGYLAVGGIAHARPGSFMDALFFSVQTMGTIGYGAMYPESPAANMLVVSESVVGLVVTALATGLVFNKFSLTRSQVVFSQRIAFGPMNGVPTLTFRVGNDRANAIMDATLRVVLMRTEITSEGMTFYRMTDLPLVRDRSPAVSRSWTVLHTVDAQSPLHGATPETLTKWEAEFIVTLVGTDDTSLQPVHARRRYVDTDIAWGHRLADVLSERPDGKLALDITRFHDLEPTKPTPTFPYPAPSVPTDKSPSPPAPSP